MGSKVYVNPQPLLSSLVVFSFWCVGVVGVRGRVGLLLCGRGKGIWEMIACIALLFGCSVSTGALEVINSHTYCMSSCTSYRINISLCCPLLALVGLTS